MLAPRIWHAQVVVNDGTCPASHIDVSPARANLTPPLVKPARGEHLRTMMCFDSSQDDFICRRNTARGWGGLLTMAGSTKTSM
jgi:hypothetical protein